MFDDQAFTIQGEDCHRTINARGDLHPDDVFLELPAAPAFLWTVGRRDADVDKNPTGTQFEAHTASRTWKRVVRGPKDLLSGAILFMRVEPFPVECVR